MNQPVFLRKLDLLICLIILVSLNVFAENSDQQLPMYGDIGRSNDSEFVEQDKKLIAEATRIFGTREHASEGYVERAFEHYSNNEFDKSMSFFNQAWILNKENPFVYLGFGLLMNRKAKPCEAYDMFKQANEKGLKEEGFLADYAHTTSQCALLKEEDVKENLFIASNNLYKLAIQTPNKQLLAYVYHSWAKSCFLQKNFSKSLELLEQSKKLGGTIDSVFQQTLLEQIK